MRSSIGPVLAIAMVIGCSGPKDNPGATQTLTTGGAGGTTEVAGSGGSSALPGNTGGTSSLIGNTGGLSSTSATTGGATGTLVVTGGSPAATGGVGTATGGKSSSTGGVAATTGGVAAATGGKSSNTGGVSSSTGGVSAATGGKSANAGGVASSTGGIGTATGGKSSSTGGVSSSTGGVSAATGGKSGSTGGSSGTSSTSLVPPARDTASKVPISSAPGYTVEGNYPYGPQTAQRLDIIYPAGAGPKGTQVLPMVLMFHGGAWIHSYNNNSGKDHMSTFFDRFLAHGFIVCNAEYRVNDGSADGAVAPAAVQDALLAAKWCWDYMDYFHGDRARYVVTGASAGGHLALMVGMTTPAAGLGPTSPNDFKIAAIVDGYGPADIEAELNGVAASWLPASLPNRAAIAKEVNPMTYVRGDIPPLIVVQGANDTTAPVADSRRLVALLTAAGADVSMHEVPGAGHGFATPVTAWPDAEKAMFDWLTARGIGK